MFYRDNISFGSDIKPKLIELLTNQRLTRNVSDENIV